MKFLDFEGLSNLWDEMNPHVIFYGVCNTPGNQQAKTVTVNGLTNVVNGTHLIVKFTEKNTEATPTLSVNSNSLKTPAVTSTISDENGKTLSSVTAGYLNKYCEFIFDGDTHRWVLISSQFGNQVIYTETNTEPAGEDGMIWMRKKD